MSNEHCPTVCISGFSHVLLDAYITSKRGGISVNENLENTIQNSYFKIEISKK